MGYLVERKRLTLSQKVGLKKQSLLWSQAFKIRIPITNEKLKINVFQMAHLKAPKPIYDKLKRLKPIR